jgi:hypothetical protein
MYLQYTYTNPVATSGGSGSGIYYYHLPSGYTINTSVIQMISTPVDGSAYGTILGYANFETFAPSTIRIANNCGVYCTGPSQVSIFIPSRTDFLTGTSILMAWHSSEWQIATQGCARYSFNCEIPIN